MSENFKRRQVVMAMFASVSAAAMAFPAAAQSANENDGLEEIVVTARKTTENVQSVPLSVNVVSGEDLQERGVAQLSNLSGAVSNLVWVDAGGGTFTNKITLRGIYSNATSQGFDPGVAIYVDDIYVGNQFGFNSALLDIERIEVLKGPQGTLFGRNAAAGAISVHTTRPDTKDAALIASAGYGNYDRSEFKLLGNMPISDAAAFKVSGIYRARDGYQRNVVTGKRNLNDERFYGGRAQLLLSPGPDLDILLTGEYFRNNDHQDIYSCLAAAGALPCPNATIDDVLSGTAADNGSYTKRRMWGASLAIDWAISDAIDLKSITAVRGLKAFQDQDQDYSPVDVIRSGFRVPKSDQFSQELRLESDQSRRFRGMVGLYYYNERRTTEIPLILTAEALQANYGANTTQDFVQITHSELATDSYAAFGQAQFDITPVLTLEGGLRYTHDDKGFVYEQTENSSLAFIPPPVQQALYLVPFARNSAKASFGKATYTASLSWKAGERVLVYGRYATGYKAGGFQAATNSPNYNPLVPFGPENSAQAEIGVKAETSDRRLRFNIAAFATEYKDTQVQISDSVTFQKIVGNFGKARARGVEVEVSARPVSGLTLDANLGLQRSKFVDGPFDGRKFQYVPRRTFSVSAAYEREISGNATLFASGTVVNRSSMNLNTDLPGAPGSEFLVSRGVTTVNARLGLEFAGNYGIYLWGNNLTNERRFTDYRGQGPVQPPVYHISEPRTYGVELKATF